MKTKFALFSIFWAILHLIVEVWAYVSFGSYFPMFFVDLIAITLLLGGAFLFLKQGWSFGLLCGAWGFEACLNYRAYFIRLSGIAGETAGDFTQTETTALGASLILVFIFFGFSLWHCKPKS